MFRIFLTTAAVLGAALFGPYLFYSASQQWKQAQQSLLSLGTPGEATDAAEGDQSEAADPQKPALPPVAGPPVQDFGEVFRFDIPPGWVIERWPRVVTGLAQLQLSGHRIPLVTGTQPTDLAVVLTYYFDNTRHCQRITFRGTTGDPRRLLTFLARRYRFAYQPANDPALTFYRALDENGELIGSLELRSAWTVKADQPYRRYDVDLYLERPQESRSST